MLCVWIVMLTTRQSLYWEREFRSKVLNTANKMLKMLLLLDTHQNSYWFRHSQAKYG